MSQRRAGNPNRCPTCKINYNLCVCIALKPTSIKTQVSLVVHVRELKLTSNTAQFVEKMLPEQAQLFIRGKVFENFTTDAILSRPGRKIFLYPHDDALEINSEFMQTHPGPYHLIVPDGNWHQARRVRRREEGFKDIMAVRLPPGIETEYKLRKAPQPNWVSTYEAVAHTLGILEGIPVRDQMMDFFRVWVKTTLHGRSGAGISSLE